MAQLPPDSQRATWSHSPSVAAPACPARAMLPVPITAPVKAIFATFTADVVGLRCRPIGTGKSSRKRLRGQLSGSGWRGYPASVAHGDFGFTPRSRGSWSFYIGGPVGSPASIRLFSTAAQWMEFGVIGHSGPPEGGVWLGS